MTLRETLERIRGMDVLAKEETTITHIIVPILTDLGWPFETISPQHWVGGRNEGGRADIALMENNRCVCVVEAKRPGINLIEHIDQVFRYAFYEGVTFCILTDGLEWRLYLPREKGRLEERLFAVLQLKKNPIKLSENDLKRFLSREAVLSGAAERDAGQELNQLHIDRELPRIWRKMLTEPDEELVTWVRKRIFEKHDLSPSADQVAAVLSVQGVSPSRLAQASDTDKARVKARKQREILGATVLGVHKELHSGKDMWLYVVEQVHARHSEDFMEKAAQIRGTKREFISGSYQNKNRPERVGNTEVFVETDMTIDEFERRSRQLLKLFGYPDSALQIHER